MIRGMYTAATGMIAQAMQQDVIANNLANQDTPGFKRSGATVGAFPWQDVVLGGNGVAATQAAVGTGSVLDRTSLDWSEGTAKKGGPLDVAINGPGFFRVQNGQGQAYVRAGTFHISANGVLVDPKGRPVEGRSGTIHTSGKGEVRIDQTGAVYEGDTKVGQLAVYRPASTTRVTALDTGEYRLNGPVTAVSQPSFQPGMIESSNVDPIRAMTAMMSASRAYQASAQAFRSEDAAARQATNDVGKF